MVREAIKEDLYELLNLYLFLHEINKIQKRKNKDLFRNKINTPCLYR